jgi:hypothetical protein
MKYPTITEVENCLKIIASEVGDTMDAPFRVDMIARYGGKPPLYTVFIRVADKEPIRRKLSQVLDRKLVWERLPSRSMRPKRRSFCNTRRLGDQTRNLGSLKLGRITSIASWSMQCIHGIPSQAPRDAGETNWPRSRQYFPLRFD